MPFLSHPLTERSEDGGREERDEQRIGEAKRRRDEVRHGPTADPRSLRSLVPLPPTGRAGEPSGRMGWVGARVTEWRGNPWRGEWQERG